MKRYRYLDIKLIIKLSVSWNDAIIRVNFAGDQPGAGMMMNKRSSQPQHPRTLIPVPEEDLDNIVNLIEDLGEN